MNSTLQHSLMYRSQYFQSETECHYEITDSDGWSQRLWLLAACLRTNVVRVYEGVLVPVLWSRQNEEPILSTEILTRKVRTEHFGVDNTYESFLADARENGKDIGMILARSFNEEKIELLKEYIKDNLYEVYEQFLFRAWITECVGNLKKFVADEKNGIIATMQVPGFGTIPGVAQEIESNHSGVLMYTSPRRILSTAA